MSINVPQYTHSMKLKICRFICGKTFVLYSIYNDDHEHEKCTFITICIHSNHNIIQLYILDIVLLPESCSKYRWSLLTLFY